MARSAKTGSDATDAPEVLSVSGSAANLPLDTESGVPAQENAAETYPAEAALDSQATDSVDAPPTDSVLIVDPAPEPIPAAAAPPTPTPTARKPRSVLLPLVLGGVVAAALGYVAAWLPNRSAPDASVALAEQSALIADLQSQIAELPAPTPAPDLSPLAADIASLRTEITDQLSPLSERLAAFEARIVTLERAPAADGTLSDTAIASWEAELDRVRADLAAQQARMQDLADQAAARLDAAQSTVTEIEQDATASATAVLQRATLSRMQAAVDSGAPFDVALNELTATGIAVPDLLAANAADGVATVAALADGFPVVARAALATARAEGLADDGDSRVWAFFRSQFDARSVTPREGDDPDAILSRAEAALAEARLSDALAEIAALPEVVRADMSGWITQAEARIGVVAALQGLSETLPATVN